MTSDDREPPQPAAPPEPPEPEESAPAAPSDEAVPDDEAAPDGDATPTDSDLEASDADKAANQSQDHEEPVPETEEAEPEEAEEPEAVAEEPDEEWAPELESEDEGEPESERPAPVESSDLETAPADEPAIPSQDQPQEVAAGKGRRNLWRLPNTRSQLSVAILCALLGFAAVVQVRSLDEASTLQGARQSDLIRILDDVTDRSKRLQDERAQLEATKQELLSGTDRAKTALLEAQKRAETLGILAGTLPAHGPGIQLTIVDPEQRVDAPVLLNTLQELRDAGAEAVQINDVRVVASTDLLDSAAGAVRVAGREVRAPYVFKVIGEPDTLTAALGIPGGVFAELKGRGAEGLVDKREDIEIDALRAIERPQYARPARDAGSRD